MGAVGRAEDGGRWQNSLAGDTVPRHGNAAGDVATAIPEGERRCGGSAAAADAVQPDQGVMNG